MEKRFERIRNALIKNISISSSGRARIQVNEDWILGRYSDILYKKESIGHISVYAYDSSEICLSGDYVHIIDQYGKIVPMNTHNALRNTSRRTARAIAIFDIEYLVDNLFNSFLGELYKKALDSFLHKEINEMYNLSRTKLREFHEVNVEKKGLDHYLGDGTDDICCEELFYMYDEEFADAIISAVQNMLSKYTIHVLIDNAYLSFISNQLEEIDLVIERLGGVVESDKKLINELASNPFLSTTLDWVDWFYETYDDKFYMATDIPKFKHIIERLKDNMYEVDLIRKVYENC